MQPNKRGYRINSVRLNFFPRNDLFDRVGFKLCRG